MKDSDVPQYPMRVVARKSSLSPHVIRVWERRYKAVTPPRTDTNRRLYSDEDIRRLTLLRQATGLGHSIGLIANRSNEELESLLKAERPRTRSGDGATLISGEESSSAHFLQLCKDATARMDARALEDTLGLANTHLSTIDILDGVVGPLMEFIGMMWRDGILRVAHEHLASDAVRSFLTMRRSAFAPAANAPAIVITTPAGQTHELGAMMVSTLACEGGWRDIYLGPNLPSSDIVAAVRGTGARALALSLVYPGDDPFIESELAFLRRHLPDDTPIFVGGRAAGNYSEIIERIGGELCATLGEFRARLERFRTPAAS